MDTSRELTRVADELEAVARALFAIERAATGRPSEKPTHELARSVAYWMIAIRRLARTGRAAWDALESRFPADAGDGTASVDPTADTAWPEEPAELVSELDVVSAFITGDMALDDLAYAELVRRGSPPRWQVGVERVPAMWPLFMAVIDNDPSDPMAKDARYLDVTLAVARDVLVAHRDPTWMYLPMWSNWGEVKLARVAIEPDRRAAGLAELQAVNASLAYPWPNKDDYHSLLNLLLAIAGRLGPKARAAIRSAYRFAGFESPHLVSMVSAALHLLGLHIEELRKTTGTNPQALS